MAISNCPASGQYAGDLRTAMDAVLSENPDVASLPSTDANDRANARTFLKLVETKLKSTGFNATVEVLNGHDNPSTGDIIAVWKEGDTEMERYDAILGDQTKTIAETAITEFIGTVALNCTTSGGGKDCKCANTALPPPQNFSVPNQGLPTDLGQLVSAIFTWSLRLIGLVIFVRFFYAGFLWFTAAGNATNVGKAQGIMKNAVYGALVLFSAWLILNTINPDLVGGKLDLPGLPAGSTSETSNGNNTNNGLYTCGDNNKCVASPQGEYDSSDCYQACPK